MHYATGTLIDLFFEFEVQLLGGEESPAGRHHTLSPQPHRFLLGLGKRRREKIIAGMGKKTIVIVFGHQSFVPMRRQHHPGSRAGLSHFGIGARPQYLDLIDNPRFPDRIGDSAGSKAEGTMVRHLGPQAGPVSPVKVHVSVSVKHGILQGFGPRRQEESRSNGAASESRSAFGPGNISPFGHFRWHQGNPVLVAALIRQLLYLLGGLVEPPDEDRRDLGPHPRLIRGCPPAI